MKIKHISLLVLSATGFLASCSCSATDSADKKILNDANAAVEKSEDPIITCHDAVLAAQKAGVDLEAHQLANDKYCFAFDFDVKRFVIMDDGSNIIHAPSHYEYNKDTYRYFKFTDAYDSTEIYSQYLTRDFAGADMLIVTTGLDMGDNWNVKNLVYNNTSGIEKDIILRTYSDYLTITAPSDNITHYGDANNVFVTSMGEDKEFHAYGAYAYLQPSAGNIYLESGASTDLFELKEGSTAKVNVATGVSIEAAINAPTIPTNLDLDIHEINDNNPTLITDATIATNKTGFFRLNSDVTFNSNQAWKINNNVFLDLNGHKISFTKGSHQEEGYYYGILVKPIDQNVEAFIIDTQSTLFERPSIELNDCDIIVAGTEDYSATLYLTSGRVTDIRNTYNNPAVLVLGNEEDNKDRVEHKSSFYMYGGYIRGVKGPSYAGTAFKCIQPRGKGAYVNMVYGDLDSPCYCISGQGSIPGNHQVDLYGDTVIDIKGGTLIGGKEEKYTPLFFPQSGKVTIDGGNIIGRTCIDIKAGDLSITGGTFNSYDEYNAQITAQNDGSTSEGSAILVEATYHYFSDININITNTKMTSENAYIVHAVGPVTPDLPKTANINITGGNFNYKIDPGYAASNFTSPDDFIHFKIEGGTWTPANR